jgi:hypothetical protein
LEFFGHYTTPQRISLSRKVRTPTRAFLGKPETLSAFDRDLLAIFPSAMHCNPRSRTFVPARAFFQQKSRVAETNGRIQPIVPVP